MKEKVFDYVIVGAGPAGLQLGYFMQQAGWNYLIVEAGSGPGQFDLPWGIDLDKDGLVYIVDWRNDRIQQFTPDG